MSVTIRIGVLHSNFVLGSWARGIRDSPFPSHYHDPGLAGRALWAGAAGIWVILSKVHTLNAKKTAARTATSSTKMPMRRERAKQNRPTATNRLAVPIRMAKMTLFPVSSSAWSAGAEERRRDNWLIGIQRASSAAAKMKAIAATA